MFRRVATNGSITRTGSFAVLIIGDKYGQGELVPLGFLCMQEMNKVGFVTKSIVVKNIEVMKREKVGQIICGGIVRWPAAFIFLSTNT